MSLPPALIYNLNATFDSNLHGGIAGYDTSLGFARCQNGFSNPWLCDVLNQKVDTSYLFIGGGFNGGSGTVFPRATFALDYDTDGVYTAPSSGAPAVGETIRTSVAIPNEKHRWKLTFRWRVVGGTPTGCSDEDTAIGFVIDELGGPTSTVISKTWGEASPTFRTDTITIKSPGGGDTTTELGFAQTFSSGSALMLDPTDPPSGPNFLPTQIAWMELSGPHLPPIRTSGSPGGRRAHFS